MIDIKKEMKNLIKHVERVLDSFLEDDKPKADSWENKENVWDSGQEEDIWRNKVDKDAIWNNLN